jgi:ADP-heptose:LPS heptosyltransferase
VRYGAFGDSIQASSLLPALKEQGFHITFYGTPRSAAVLEHDPHIDAFYLQGVDQVPNVLLGDFWANEKKKFDRWINLSESVEGHLLAMPGRPNHAWPIQVRRKHMDTNYFEFAHELAEVPMPPKPKFYATDEEKAWARKERKRIGGDMLLMYSLAGSAVHKTWPWQDHFFMRILTAQPNARIVTVGDEMSQMLEQGWENESRVVCKAGKYTIRESMALLAECDMVVGSETGILNAAGHMPMPKIVFLSHSSANNLTKHWVNTTSLEPQATACYPCHMMHYSFEHCHKDEETGVAKCQANISLDSVWAAYQSHLQKAA